MTALPLQGPTKGACQCLDDACDLFGTLKKPWSDGRRCVRGCPCRRCMGKNNRAKGDRKERGVAKLLGATGANTRHEEHRGGPVRYESKAGSQVGPIWTRFQAARAQSEQSRSIGDHRPFVMAACPDGTSEKLFVVSSRDWPQVIAACAQDMGLVQ